MMVMRKCFLAMGALAVAFGFTGAASAQTFTCPVTAGGNGDQLSASAISDQANEIGGAVADGAEGAIPGSINGYDDFSGETAQERFDDALADVPLFAELAVLTAVVTDPNLDIGGQSVQVHDVVCQLFADNMNHILDNGNLGGDFATFSLLIPNVVEKLTVAELMAANDQTDFEERYTDLITNEDNFTVKPDLAGFDTNFALLGDETGDLDNDGKTNLTEWQEAANANTTDFDAAVSEFVASMLAGSDITVTIDGPTEVFSERADGFRRTFGPYTATTAVPDSIENPPADDTSYTWGSSDSSVLEVQTTSGPETQVEGVNPGTATLSATGNNSEATGSATINVVVPEWFEVCELGERFSGQGQALADALGCDLVNTPTFNDDFFDSEALLVPSGSGGLPIPELGGQEVAGIAGDGARDAFQLQLLAYTLCALGGEEGAATFTPGGKSFVGDANDVLADFESNFAALQTFVGEVNGIINWLVEEVKEVDVSPNETTITPTGSVNLSATSEFEAGGGGEENIVYSPLSGGALINLTDNGDGTAVVDGADNGEGVAVVAATGVTSGISDAAVITVANAPGPGGPSVTVTVEGGGGEAIREVGGTLELAAESSDNSDSDADSDFDWSSGTPGVATVDGDGTVTAVATGTTTITATSNVTATSGTIDVTVGIDPGCAKTFQDFDADSLLPNGEGVTKGLVAVLDELTTHQSGAVAELAAAVDPSAPGTSATIDGTIDALSDPAVLKEFVVLASDDGLGLLSDIADVGHLTAALAGMSSEGKGTVTGILNGLLLAGQNLEDLFALDMNGAPVSGTIAEVVAGVISLQQGLAAIEASVGGDFANAGLTETEELQTDVNAAAAKATELDLQMTILDPNDNPIQVNDGGTVQDFDVPNFAIYDGGAKAAGEPFSGSGDWDGDGTTNAEVSQAVSGAGGDFEDFVNGSAGLSPFWAGNEGLPAAGFLGLGLLAGAIAAGGTIAVRRRTA